VKQKGRCWVEIDGNNIIRIFRNQGMACSSSAFDEDRVREYSRKDAVESIRKQVSNRAKYLCERCGERIGWGSGHMDEKISKGDGGEVSVFNCWWLCYDCHIGDNGYSEHSERFWGGGGKWKI
jgi:hypothetical protein